MAENQPPPPPPVPPPPPPPHDNEHDRREIRVVAITGGTHGNESTSIALARHLLRNPPLTLRPSFQTRILLANPAAVGRNVRYVDEDLNRCFLRNDLDNPDDNGRDTHSLESKRAREINAMLGPKGSPSPAVDLIIDLHNTTANTGVALMMPPTDELCHSIGTYLQRYHHQQQQQQQQRRDSNSDSNSSSSPLSSSAATVRIVDYTAAKNDYPMLPTVAPHGMTFEVGPVSPGCIDGALFHQSLNLVLVALDYVHAHNLAVRACSGSGGCEGASSDWHEVEVPVFRAVRTVDYPRYDDDGGGGDGDGNEKDGNESTTTTPYPDPDPGGPHAMIAAAVHPDIRGRDFCPLRRGDPAFLTMEGETVGFDVGRDAADDEEEEDTDANNEVCYPFFIDETSYYEKGIAFMVAHCSSRRVWVLKSV